MNVILNFAILGLSIADAFFFVRCLWRGSAVKFRLEDELTPLLIEEMKRDGLEIPKAPMMWSGNSSRAGYHCYLVLRSYAKQVDPVRYSKEYLEAIALESMASRLSFLCMLSFFSTVFLGAWAILRLKG